MQQQQQLISDTELKIACQNAIEAVRQNDIKKVKRYLTKYAGQVSKVSYLTGVSINLSFVTSNLLDNYM